MIALTVGEGLRVPRGHRYEVPKETPPVEAVVGALRQIGGKKEQWWSPFLWRGDYRLADSWESACGVAVDVDYGVNGAQPSAAEVAALETLARAGKLAGSAFHPTPHGCRVVFVFGQNCTECDAYRSAALGAGALVSASLTRTELHDYHVDEPLLEDLGRLFFAPNAFAKGVQRKAEVLVMRQAPYTPEELARARPIEMDEPEATASPRVAQGAQARTGPISADFAEAIVKWNAAHPVDWPKNSAPCPVCKDVASFGALPDHDGRWYCFSTDHPDAVGVHGKNGYHGDALDLECHARGRSKAEVLRADGYLAPPPKKDSAKGGTVEARADGTVPIHIVARPLKSRSYLTAVTILDGNLRNVLNGRKLELNEMTGRPELGRQPLRDADVSAIRAEIERVFAGGHDKQGNEVGLALAVGDMFAACEQVAHASPYHPVREYLNGLAWDGVERVNAVAGDILDAEPTTLNISIVRRFFISAVARAMSPGCKVDTVLITIGKQGIGKSTFFSVLANPWFIDSYIDISKKDSYEVLRTTWIFEWAELSVLRRAKDVEQVKAFLSSRVDSYRNSYGRFSSDVPRTCMFVGSTNSDEFLTDDENRRFWPLRVGAIRLNILRAQRDQLWAEAVAIYRTGEQWHLTEGEEALLRQRHTEHVVLDVWDDAIVAWAEKRLAPFSATDVLSDALGKVKGGWVDADLKRVSRSLRRAGFTPVPKVKGESRTWERLPKNATEPGTGGEPG